MPISLQQFQAICQDRYPNVQVVTTRPGEPFPDKVFYDCQIMPDVKLRLCLDDKYLDDHVIILNDDWSVYTFSPEELTRELDFIDPR